MGIADIDVLDDSLIHESRDVALQLTAVPREPVVGRPSQDLQEVVVSEEVVAQPWALEDPQQALLRDVTGGQLSFRERLEIEPERLPVDTSFWRSFGAAIITVDGLVLDVDIIEALVRAVLRVLVEKAAVDEQTGRGSVQRRGHLGAQSELNEDLHVVEHTLLVAPEQRAELDGGHASRATPRRDLEEVEDHRRNLRYLDVVSGSGTSCNSPVCESR